MATLTATAASSTAPAKYMVNGTITRVVQFSLTDNPALSTGDVIRMLKVPSGAAITDLTLITDALSGGNYTVTIGDGNSAARYSGSLSTGSTSSINRLSLAGGFGYSYSTEDTVDITIGTATTATVSGVIKLAISYTLDN